MLIEFARIGQMILEMQDQLVQKPIDIGIFKVKKMVFNNVKNFL